jgi:hypothetical protein
MRIMKLINRKNFTVIENLVHAGDRSALLPSR